MIGISFTVLCKIRKSTRPKSALFHQKHNCQYFGYKVGSGKLLEKMYRYFHKNLWLNVIWVWLLLVLLCKAQVKSPRGLNLPFVVKNATVTTLTTKLPVKEEKQSIGRTLTWQKVNTWISVKRVTIQKVVPPWLMLNLYRMITFRTRTTLQIVSVTQNFFFVVSSFVSLDYYALDITLHIVWYWKLLTLFVNNMVWVK